MLEKAAEAKVTLVHSSLQELNDQLTRLESGAENLRQRLSSVLRPDESPTLGSKEATAPPSPVPLVEEINGFAKRLRIVRSGLELIFDQLEL